jgi:hypothetical protein
VRDAGLKGFWAGYFANRAAPLGRVDAGPATAAFYNFHPDMVAKAIPACWEIVAPAELVVQRAAAAAYALTQLCDAASLEDLIAALPLLCRAADNCDGDGRVMTGANAALSASFTSALGQRHRSGMTQGVAEAWQACTTLREQRGDGHAATLLSHGISGLEAHVLVAATEGSPVETLRDNRGWSEGAWADAVAGLSRRGLVHDDGRASTRGHEMRQSVESLTDQLARAPFDALSDHEVTALHAVLVGCARQVQDSGLYPFPNPMGLPRLSLS